MLSNEDRNGPGLSNSTFQGVPSPSQVAGVAAEKSLNRQPPQSAVYPKGDQGVSSRGPWRNSPPPLGLSLTCHRLLIITTAILWGSIKFTLAWQDKVPSFASTTVDVIALLFGIVLYWLGLYEYADEKN
ncbi:hypothetical protein EDB85DRAFT_1951880 [Lactarius pseudohatsudake]|nr:hypothetical protein EDB85DRAFT_1951880 [Lactarius pseudohatsudake]